MALLTLCDKKYKDEIYFSVDKYHLSSKCVIIKNYETNTMIIVMALYVVS